MEIGKINSATINSIDKDSVTICLADGTILSMDKKEMKEEYGENATLEVFIYNDSKVGLVATQRIPYAIVGEFDFLEVVKVTKDGALLDWGIKKNLFLPSREQTTRLIEGESYLVYVLYDDNTKQIIGTMHIDEYLSDELPTFKRNEEVEILVIKETPLGFKAIINDKFQGLIYHNEVFEHVCPGMRTQAYIKSIREDGKIDLALQKQGYDAIETIAEQLLKELERHGGFLPVTDKTDSETIGNKFGCSKKNFKKAVGALYKQRQIDIEEKGIRLLEVV
jgi:predicted RNA-binding protein (virulence factor B family)